MRTLSSAPDTPYGLSAGDGGAVDQAVRAALDALPAGPGPGDLPPLPPLSEALQQIDRVFGLERILRHEGTDRVARYYRVSEWGYRRVHSTEGCMHLALSASAAVQPDDFGVQARTLARIIRTTGAQRVLELGSGHGYNLTRLAAEFPGVRFTGLDLLPRHVAKARKAAQHLPNAAFLVGNYDTPPPGLREFDLVFAVEALCHSPDYARTARAVARSLARDGVFVLFDALRTAPLQAMAPAMATAVRLYETVTTVSRGFRTEAALAGATASAGLVPLALHDATRATLPGVRRLHGYGQRFFSRRSIRLLTAPLPTELRHNACAALLGPYLVQGDPPHAEPGLRYVAGAFRHV